MRIIVPMKYADIFRGLANSPLVKAWKKGGKLVVETPVGFTLMLKLTELPPREYFEFFSSVHLEGGYKRWGKGVVSFLPRRTRKLTIRLSPEESALLKKIAEVKETSVSEYVVSAVLEKILQDCRYLADHEHL